MTTVDLTPAEVNELQDYLDSRARQSVLEDKGKADPDDWARLDDEADRLVGVIAEKVGLASHVE